MHYTLLVTVDGAVKEDGIDKAIAEILNPFSELLEVDPYPIDPATQPYHYTWQETVAKSKAYYERSKQEVLALTPGDYEDHEYIEYASTDVSNFTDLDWIKLYVGDDEEWVEDGKGGYVEMSTWNPKAKWDWWVVGGRWENFLNRVPNGTETDPVWGTYPVYKDGTNILRRRNLRAPQSTYSYVTKDGEWFDKPDVDWSLPEREALEKARDLAWDKQMAEYLLTVPGEDWLVIVDIHS